MLLRRFTDYILQGRYQAVGIAFIFAFIPILGSISILIAALVTLRKGAFEGALVTLAATMPYVFGYAFAGNQTYFMLFATYLMVVSNVLTWLFALPLRRFSNWSITLEFAGLIGIIVVLIVHMTYPDVQSWWGTQVQAYLNKADTLVDPGAQDTVLAPGKVTPEVVAYVKRYATGIMVAVLLFNVFTQLLLARWWQAIMFNPGGLRIELRQVRLSLLAATVFLAAMILSMLNTAVVLDMMPILYMIFCIGGLSLIHNLLSNAWASWLWLMLVYIGIIVLFPLSVVLVAIVGLFDTLLDFRKRLRSREV